MSDLRKKIEEKYEEHEPALLFMDGFDDCIAGVVQRFNDVFVIYDVQKVLAQLMQDGMTYAEAFEFWEFNQVGAWVGESTPGFLDTEISDDPAP
jgi:hypothetical protein